MNKYFKRLLKFVVSGSVFLLVGCSENLDESTLAKKVRERPLFQPSSMAPGGVPSLVSGVGVGELIDASPPTTYAGYLAAYGQEISFEYDCSDTLTKTMGGNFKAVAKSSIWIELIDSSGVRQCRLQSDVIYQDLVNIKSLTTVSVESACPGLTPGNYTLKIPSVQVGVFEGLQSVKPVMDSLIYWETFNSAGGVAAGSGIPVKATRNSEDKKLSLVSAVPVGARSFLLYGDRNSSDACSYTGNSPLILRIASRSQILPLQLTEPLRGILFDILGRNSRPVRHALKRISWFTEAMGETFFLVLPSASSQVNGIDQLFGNNTFGPDRKFSSNGYEALRKWDFNSDGRIDERDPVFDRLRLWEDKNLDGVAQPEELSDLGRFNIESFDLSYDASFLEEDKYGNRTTMRSTAKTKDGTFHGVYDLWFRSL